MNVLSLFDGISCGRVALARAGISVGAYYASEIEPKAIAIARANYPDIVEIGDAAAVSFRDGVLHSESGDFETGSIDLLMGGSPCTDFSSIGRAKGMKSGGTEVLSLEQYLEMKADGMRFDGQSYLFWEYVRILHEAKPKHFLLENVEMSKKWRRIIDGALGAEPVKINSALVSAQNRPRLYWTDIPGVEPPQDRNVVLDDILDPAAPLDDVAGCLTVQRSLPRLMARYGKIPPRFNPFNATEVRSKACALSRGSMVTSSCATLLFAACAEGVHTVKDGILDGEYPTELPDGRYALRRLSLTEMERLQTLPDGYTAVEGVGKQKRSAAIGNGWTVDAVAHILSYLKEK